MCLLQIQTTTIIQWTIYMLYSPTIDNNRFVHLWNMIANKCFDCDNWKAKWTEKVVFGSHMSKAFRAASSGKLSTLKEIIESNPDIMNQCNRDGYTPFSIAIASQQSGTDYLLQLDNLDINAKS